MDNTKRFLDSTKLKVENEAIQILARDNRNATGRLSESMWVQVENKANKFMISFQYADYGKYVLDSNRKINYYRVNRGGNGSGRSKVLESIQRWILDKGIPVRGINNKNGKPTKSRVVKEKRGTGTDKSPQEKALINFSFAIWNSWKNNKRIKAPVGKSGTNFVKPWNDLWKPQSTFRKDLRAAIVKDAGKAFRASVKNDIKSITIKM